MAKRNGGIIGPSNVPTGQYGGTASGVWRLRDAFNYIKAGLWPVAGNYPVGNSLRFNSGSTDYLQRTPASAGSLTTWTYSFWTKRSKLATAEQYLSAGPRGGGGNVEDQIYSISTDAINWYDGTAASNVLRTTQLFRDVSAWYHLMFVWDTTNATAGNRARIYVNGAEVTAFSIDNNPSLNAVSKFNGTGQHRIGQTGTVAGENLDGYLAEVIFIDGQALTPSSFGLTDSATGIWIPKPYTGTYGTNGFYLNFANSADLGNDVSGNNNDWTVNNLTSVDQSTDTPTNNFCTLNPLYYGTNRTITEGNLKVVGTTTAWSNGGQGTIGVTAGKWYMEGKVSDADGDTGYCFGWGDQAVTYTGGVVSPTKKAYNRQTSAFYNNQTHTNSYFTTVSAGDILMCAFDVDNGKIWFGVNGTWQNSNGIALNTTYSSTTLNPSYPDTTGITIDTTGAGVYTPNSAVYNDGYVEWNFGNPPFTIASGNADANGYGNFEYAVPSGFYALNTKNLAQYG